MIIAHADLADRDIRCLIRSGKIKFAGNRNLKIYGRLDCASGRRMKRDHRVFFESPVVAAKYGFRPCGHCLKNVYREWRASQK